MHTPHLEDKLKGTWADPDVIKRTTRRPERVIIDHVEEHTVKLVLDTGCGRNDSVPGVKMFAGARD